MITVNELFSGIGTQSLAFKYLGVPHKVVGMAEIEKNAIKAYEVLHGETKNYGDVSKVDELDYADLWTYSFPCFTGDTLVLTNSGYKKIVDITTEDEVYTHKGRFRPVLKTFDNGIHEIWELKTANVDIVRTTKKHRFYVVTRSKKWDKELNKNVYVFTEPYWKECFELTKNDYVLSPTYTIEEDFKYEGYKLQSNGRKGNYNSIVKIQPLLNNPNLYWLLGKFVGDGCLGGERKHNNKKNREIVFVTSKKNLEYVELEKRLSALGLKYTKIEQETVFRYTTSSVELCEICWKFGKGALNKRLPIEIFNLKKSLLKAFIVGYLFADGCKVGNVHKITSVSRELLYGIGVCITKCYNIPFRLYKDERLPTKIIEGRTVNQNNTYQLVFDLRPNIRRSSCVYLNDNYWYNVRDVKNTNQKEQVYDIEVEEDHSMLVNAVVAHNCQDLSSSGKGKGISAFDSEGNRVATRSGLLWEVERLLARSCGFDIEQGRLKSNPSYTTKPPKYLLLENVPELVTRKNHMANFSDLLDRLEELGYKTTYSILNGGNFGVPQNRERVFCISIRRDVYSGDFDFPQSSDFNPPISVGFDNFVDKEVRDYKGSLMIDPTISNYLLPAYTRDLEDISRCSEDIFGRKDIWTCKCTSGFQDHRIGIKWAPTIRHQNQHTAIFFNNQIHKLTASECWKFMGIKEKDFWRVKNESGISDTILCGLAGNAIVVPVLMSIFNQIALIESRGYPLTRLQGDIVPFLTINPND